MNKEIKLSADKKTYSVNNRGKYNVLKSNGELTNGIKKHIRNQDISISNFEGFRLTSDNRVIRHDSNIIRYKDLTLKNAKIYGFNTLLSMKNKMKELISKEIFLKVNDVLKENSQGYSCNYDNVKLPLKNFLKEK